MVVLVFGNVVLRYGFNTGITVSEEVSRWLFLWMTFLGAVVALREHAHLGTDMLVSRLPRAGKQVCLVIAQLAMLYVTWLLLKGSWTQIGHQPGSRGTGDRRVGGDLLRQRRLLRRRGTGDPAARPAAHADRPDERRRTGRGARTPRTSSSSRNSTSNTAWSRAAAPPPSADRQQEASAETSHDRRHLSRLAAGRHGDRHADRLFAADLAASR